MSCCTPAITEEPKKVKSCCSGKKGEAVKSDDPAIREITPIIKREIEKQLNDEQDKGCQCCIKRSDPDPEEVVDDGRPQPVTTNFRCACGTFRGCCWGTCYPGCKCPGM